MLQRRVAASLVCGDGFLPATTLGPLINEKGLQKVSQDLMRSYSYVFVQLL